MSKPSCQSFVIVGSVQLWKESFPIQNSTVQSAGACSVTVHRLPWHFLRRLPAYPGRNAARSLFFLVSHYCHLLRGEKSVWRSVRFTLLGPPGNEEEWEGSTLIDFAEIASELPHFDHGGHPARVNNARQTQVDSPRSLSLKISDECHLSPPDGYCVSSLLALSQPQDAGSSRFIGPTKRYVGVAQTLLRLMLLMRYIKTFGRVTAATRTNERVVLVDFYAEYVFGKLRCDHGTDDVCD